jgi:hypothetical protein
MKITKIILSAAVAVGTVVARGACCTSAKCLDSNSGLDRVRVKAGRLKLGVVHNDEISSPKRDRTDWKVVKVPEPGKLRVELHWDNGKARLDLGIYDVLGASIQEGRVWGSGGLRALIAVEEAGRYYIRVRGRGKRDESHYSLRLVFKPDVRPLPCDHCTVGQRRCHDAASYEICASVRDGCTAWQKAVPCAGGQSCNGGECGSQQVVVPPDDGKGECKDRCREGERRCRRGGVQVCERSSRGCLTWKSSEQCGNGKRCRDGACEAKRPPGPATVKVKIMSMYIKNGRMTLHLEVGDKAEDLEPGQIGVVLEGSTDKALPDGKVKILKVIGRFAIASTKLKDLGDNRWVKIDVR